MKPHSPLVKIFISNLLPVRWALAWFALLFAAGLLLIDIPTREYASLLIRSPLWIWTMSSVVYAAIRFYTCFVFDKVAKVISVIGSVFGTTIWGYVFLSFINNKMPGVGPDDFILLAIILCEVWVCASTLSDYNTIERRVH